MSYTEIIEQRLHFLGFDKQTLATLKKIQKWPIYIYVIGSPFLAGNSVAVNSLGAIITILDTGYLMLDKIQTGL